MKTTDLNCDKDIEEVIHAVSTKILDITKESSDRADYMQLPSMIKALADLVSAKASYDKKF